MNFFYCRFEKLVLFGQSVHTLLNDLETARGIKDERNRKLIEVLFQCTLVGLRPIGVP